MVVSMFILSASGTSPSSCYAMLALTWIRYHVRYVTDLYVMIDADGNINAICIGCYVFVLYDVSLIVILVAVYAG